MSSPPTTPNVPRRRVRRLVLETSGDEDPFLSVIGEVWEDMSYQTVDMDSQIIKQLYDTDFLHKVKNYHISFSLPRKKWGSEYVDSVITAINDQLQTLRCGCTSCNVRFPNTL